MSPVEFRILGPLAVRAGPDRLELGGARQQVALAVLLLNANHVVSVGRLLEAVYGEEPPPTARAQTQITISALRRLLAAPGQDGIISTRGQGYAIEAGDGQLDAPRCTRRRRWTWCGPRGRYRGTKARR